MRVLMRWRFSKLLALCGISILLITYFLLTKKNVSVNIKNKSKQDSNIKMSNIKLPNINLPNMKLPREVDNPKYHYQEKITDFVEIKPNFLIYSAYFETRTKSPFIKIMGLKNFEFIIESSNLPECFLVYNQTINGSVTILESNPVRMRVQYLIVHEFLPNAAAFFFCDLQGIVGNIHTITPNKLVIRPAKEAKIITVPITLPQYNPRKGTLAVCVRPYFGPFNNVRKLAEFIAYYRVMGATHFVFYDYEPGSDVRNYMKSYLSVMKERGFATMELLPWSLPKTVGVFEVGQLTAINDCVFRLSNRFKYVVVVDLDEYIVPIHDNDLIEFLNENDTPQIGEFNFKNTFFCENLKKYACNELGLTHRLQRIPIVYPPFLRSKYITKPNAVIEASVHWVAAFATNQDIRLYVDPDKAKSHHLRGCFTFPFFTMDYAALRHKPRLTNTPEISLMKDVLARPEKECY